jgi:hypothetical protein
LTDAAPAPEPEPEKGPEQWLAPPVGGETRHAPEAEEKVDHATFTGAVDAVVNGIRNLWHIVAVRTGDPVWEHKPEEMASYAVLVGYILKKFKKFELIMLGIAILDILTMETMRAFTFQEHQKARSTPGGSIAGPPPGAVQ